LTTTDSDGDASYAQSYMAGDNADGADLLAAANFFVSSGLVHSGYTFVNSGASSQLFILYYIIHVSDVMATWTHT
jgi:hypothetical protein